MFTMNGSQMSEPTLSGNCCTFYLCRRIEMFLHVFRVGGRFTAAH